MLQRAGLTHDAMFYGSDDEFVAGLAPFIRDGLEQGQSVTVAVTATNIGLLRDGLGTDAESVSFIDRDNWYLRPATTIAGWRRLLAEATDGGHTYHRLIGEVGFGAEERHPTWTRYEAALNDVFADAPAWIVCPYDTRTLPDTLLADARRTHPMTFDHVRRISSDYLPPERLLSSVPEPMPTTAGPAVLTMALGADIAAARHAVRELVAPQAGSASERLDDLLLVLSEVVTNSILHGQGHRELRVWWREPTVVCEVTDEGSGPLDPLAGYRPPNGDLFHGGRGLWISQQLSDVLAIDHRHGLTRVRFAIDLHATRHPSQRYASATPTRPGNAEVTPESP